jgi:hypothetical protein
MEGHTCSGGSCTCGDSGAPTQRRYGEPSGPVFARGLAKLAHDQKKEK